MKKLILASAVALSAGNAMAESDAYTNISVLKSNYDIEKVNGLELDSATGFSVAVGKKLSSSGRVATYFEGGFAYLGEASDSSAFSLRGVAINQTAKTSVSSLFGAANWEYAVTEKATVNAKLGLNYATIKFETTASSSVSSATIEDDKSEVKLLFGLGVGYALTSNVSVTAGYTSYASDISAVQAGASLAF